MPSEEVGELPPTAGEHHTWRRYFSRLAKLKVLPAATLSIRPLTRSALVMLVSANILTLKLTPCRVVSALHGPVAPAARERELVPFPPCPQR